MGEKKQTILDWYHKNQRFIDAPCGGRGACGRCKVEFLSNPPEPTEREKELLTAEEITGSIRLACMTEMVEESQFHPIGEEFWREHARIKGMEDTSAKKQENDRVRKAEAKEDAVYGVVLDIGTTTLVMRMVNLGTEKAVATVTMANPQRAYGADVITRIQLANEGKLQLLQTDLRERLVELFHTLLSDAYVKESQIKKVVVVGNTTMLHILQGYSCEGLGAVPFAPVDMSLTKKSTAAGAEVVIFPGISAFIGADIVAGMYYCDMDLKDRPHMLIDVGTNGEIVLGDKNGFWVTSTAAGPVFEGGNISCGLPSIGGGVTHLKYQKETVKEVGKWEYTFLGENAPRGICGSGLVDLTAQMYKMQIIDENGTLEDTYFDNGYTIPLEHPDGAKLLTFTQSDIRELQMGKAAIRAGMELLCRKAAPECIYLAGAFGTQIDLDSAATIGLFSKEAAEKIVPVGNTALEGAQKFLLDKDGEARVCEMIKHAQEILLANEADFEEVYIGYMQFEK